ncbi:MAG: hypothetical protein KatS3mg102_2674 [Planctomycetota bacterium]|nr:MAG: hypothetical protein KatS3mg102_2674 [Planctomycetota bacterium]
MVVDEAGEPLGVLDERELVRAVLAPCRDACATAGHRGGAERAGRLAARARRAGAPSSCGSTGTRYLLVKDGARLAGVASMRDVIRALLAEREEELRHLSSYLSGGRS